MTDQPDRPDGEAGGRDTAGDPTDDVAGVPVPGPAETAEAVGGFWTWWREFADQGAALLDSGDREGFEAELAPRLEAMHPALSWEVHESEPGTYALSLSGGGLPELRALTERWRRAGGDQAGRFEFHPAAQARPEMLTAAVQLDDHELDFSHTAFGVRFDNRRARFDVSVYHPDFLFIGEEEQLQIAALALQWVLGEDDVSRWVGLLLLAEEKPVDALPPGSLQVVVDDVAGRYAEPQWAEVSGQSPDGRPLSGLARFPLRRVDFPLCDRHIALAVPYKQRDKEGQPGKRSLAALRSFEEVLVSALGADGVLAAHVTAEGSRVFHLYVDPLTDAVDRAHEIAGEWDQGKAQVQVTTDSSWNDIAPFVA